MHKRQPIPIVWRIAARCLHPRNESPPSRLLSRRALMASAPDSDSPGPKLCGMTPRSVTACERLRSVARVCAEGKATARPSLTGQRRGRAPGNRGRALRSGANCGVSSERHHSRRRDLNPQGVSHPTRISAGASTVPPRRKQPRPRDQESDLSRPHHRGRAATTPSRKVAGGPVQPAGPTNGADRYAPALGASGASPLRDVL